VRLGLDEIVVLEEVDIERDSEGDDEGDPDGVCARASAASAARSAARRILARGYGVRMRMDCVDGRMWWLDARRP
jgi:hypothetical protein